MLGGGGGGANSRIYDIQWNLVNTTTFGPWKTGRINGVVVLKGFFK